MSLTRQLTLSVSEQAADTVRSVIDQTAATVRSVIDQTADTVTSVRGLMGSEAQLDNQHPRGTDLLIY